MRPESKEAAAAAPFQSPATVVWTKKGVCVCGGGGREVGHFESYLDLRQNEHNLATGWMWQLRKRAESKTMVSEPVQNYK